jgi:hypothetical protein
MSKTGTLRQLAETSNEKRADQLLLQLQHLQTVRLENAEQLAEIVEPLAQAMAALTDETRKILVEVQASIQAQEKSFQGRLEAQERIFLQKLERHESRLDTASTTTLNSLKNLGESAKVLTWRHYGLCAATGMISAILVLGLWRWLAPLPILTYELDVPTLVQQIRQEIEASKHSRSK